MESNHYVLRLILGIILIIWGIACWIEMIRYNRKIDKNEEEYNNQEVKKVEFLIKEKNYETYKLIVEFLSVLLIIYWIDLIFLR